MTPASSSPPNASKSRARLAPTAVGLGVWMTRVLEDCNRARRDFSPDSVHDLRVALRRCRSVADGLIAIDPHPEWRDMKKAGKVLFGSLGELRDTQVMMEWSRQLASSDMPVPVAFAHYLEQRELHLKREAAGALDGFDSKLWKRWTRSLPVRASRFRPGSTLFRHLALERWTQAYDLHRVAMKGRSRAALHRLRIGVKRLRYLVENFLPVQHEQWKDDLKHVQDLLGEIHDLDVLWATAHQMKVFPDPDSRRQWHEKIAAERATRLEAYRSSASGKENHWTRWRAGLPQGKEVESAALDRLRRWAASLDPDVRHSRHVTRLALQLYDGLARAGLRFCAGDLESREILRAASLLHDVGRSSGNKSHHKDSDRFIRRLHAPLGSRLGDMELAAVIARYHRGPLPQPGSPRLQNLSPAGRRLALQLSAILRLASSLDADHSQSIRSLTVERSPAFIIIRAAGYHARSALAEHISSGRHMLEWLSGQPILVKAAVRRPART